MSSLSASKSCESNTNTLDSVGVSGGVSFNASAKGASAQGSPLELLFGAGGIYLCYMYFGVLQEAVTKFKAESGDKFEAIWMLNALEAGANVLLSLIGLFFQGGLTKGLPYHLFGYSGTFQILAKALFTLSLTNGLSFPVATLAKSGKMIPVMLGSLILGGKTYSLKQYISAIAIIAGTVLVSSGKKSHGADGPSNMMGVVFVLASLASDGFVAGMQERIKGVSKQNNVKEKAYDMMFSTNIVMMVVAFAVSFFLGEIPNGIAFMTANPSILSKIVQFALCSALGQSFIFYTISNFDPLVCTTVTTTRKVFSVLLSIFVNGHSISLQGWGGIALASVGILSELADKMSGKTKPH